MSAPMVELDAVTAFLHSHPDIAEVAALRTGDPPVRVVAIVLGPSGSAVDVRDQVWATLAPADRPDVLLPLPELPRDSSDAVDTGRIGREALQRPGRLTFREPQTPTEVAIAAIWSEVLGRSRVGADDNFLDLGGDSMTAVYLLDLTNERLGQELTLDDLFSSPSLSALARSIDRPQ
jgi:mycobactin peptide synthetase MbtE